MNRWTIKQLQSIDDIDFAVHILYERKIALNPYSPLAKKLDEAVHTLQGIQEEQRRKQQDESKE